MCDVAELCDPVDENITGAGDIDALFVGGGVAAVGDPVVDDIGVIAGAGVTTELGVNAEYVIFRTLNPLQK